MVNRRSVRPGVLVALSVVASLAAAFHEILGAQPRPAQSLFRPLTAGAPPFAHRAERDVIRSRGTSVDAGVLQDRTTGTTIDLPLFSDVRFTAALDRIEIPGPGRLLWRGRISGLEDSDVSFAVTDGVIVGQITMPGAQYRLHPANDGLYSVEQVDTSALPSELPPVAADTSGAADTTGVPSTSVDSGAVIDVLVVYTPAARAAAGSTAAMQSLIDLAVSNTNTAYANSGVLQRLRLVHRTEVSYTENGSISTDLERLQSSTDGFADEVHALRNTYGADMVSLLTTSSEACGVGYVMTAVDSSFAPFAFNVTAWDCAAGNLSLAHELGHNMGLAHDAANAAFQAAYSYSYGYRDPGYFRTVMAYPCTAPDQPCGRIAYFSSPNRTYDGRVTGVPDASDNVRGLNNTAAITANFRQAMDAPCVYTLSATSAAIAWNGAAGSVTLTTGTGCAWTATSNAAFITITSATSGSGTGSVTFTVASNAATSARTGVLTIGGQAFTVSQAGAPCSYSLNTSSITAAAAAGTSSVTVTTSAGCAWSASTGSAFFSLQDALSRSGPGTLQIALIRNFSTSTRSATATVAGQTLTVGQSGAPIDAALQAREHARADFGGDGFNDLLWQEDVNGYLAIWALQGGASTWDARAFSLVTGDSNWRIAGTGDFNADGKPDIVWHHRGSGQIYLWYMDGVNRIGHSGFSIWGISDTRFRIAGVGDFNADGKPDIVWQHDTAGWLAVWLMNGTTLIGGLDMSPMQVDVEWKIAGVGDLNADGKSDLVWRNTRNGEIGAWLMDGAIRSEYVAISPRYVEEQEWRIVSVVDIDGDQAPDLVWHHAGSGWVAVWFMNGAMRVDTRTFPIAIETSWKIVGPK
jgi:peptidyl-Asp metalloendopeptidase